MSAVSGKCTGGGALYQVSHPLGRLGGGRGGGHNVSGVREVYWRRCSVPGESPTGEIRGGRGGGLNVSGVREVYWRRCSVPGESPTGGIRGTTHSGIPLVMYPN